MSNYNEAYNMAMDMLENQRGDDSLGIRSALNDAGSQCGISYGPDMEAFVYWAEMKMGIDMSINEEYEYEQPGGFDHMST